MGCGCGKKRVSITSAEAEEQRLAAELEERRRIETARAASGEHDPKPAAV